MRAGAARAGVIVACVRWRPSRVEIDGASMAPTLVPGDWALAVPARRVKVGDVVVLGHPERLGFELVKRVIAGPGDLAPDGTPLGADAWWVEGDAPEASTDSRSFGPVPRSQIRLRVRLIYAPATRRRTL
ncbi:MAG: S26 family signal peptidase [Actinomycetota bacterium]